jgi:hypothetical protein
LEIWRSERGGDEMEMEMGEMKRREEEEKKEVKDKQR